MLLLDFLLATWELWSGVVLRPVSERVRQSRVEDRSGIRYYFAEEVLFTTGNSQFNNMQQPNDSLDITLSLFFLGTYFCLVGL
jgi:hypothetical protein